MHVVEKNARRIIGYINRSSFCLSASKSDDFLVTHKIEISSLISPSPQSIGDFVWHLLPAYCRSHLVFCDSDESSNVSFWKVV